MFTNWKTRHYVMAFVGAFVLMCITAFGVWQVSMFVNQPNTQAALESFETSEAANAGIPVNDLENDAVNPAALTTGSACPTNIAKGMTVYVPENCTVFGDVSYGEVLLHDVGGSDQATFVNIVGSGAYITAPYGAGVEPTLPFQNYTGMVNHYVVDEMQTGCGDSNPCSEVRAVIVEFGVIVLDDVYQD